jgi:hypothetical protein
MATDKSPPPQERRKNPARRRGTVAKISVREYQVVPHAERWEVERDGAFTGAFAHDMQTAIGLAMSEAQRDKHNGIEATVCLQASDGSCRHVWP